MSKFHNYYRDAAPVQPPPPVTLPSQTPYSDRGFLHTWMAGAGLPLIQAAITSIVMMVVTATIIYIFGGWDYFKPVIGVGALSFALTWLALQMRWLNLTQLEKLTGLELDGRPGIGPQEPRRVRVQVDTVTDQGHISQQLMFDMPATVSQLKALAVGLLDEGKTLAEREWSPQSEGKPFSVQQIRDVKGEMIKRGLIVRANYKNQSLGYVLTAVGRRVVESWKALEDDDPE